VLGLLLVAGLLAGQALSIPGAPVAAAADCTAAQKSKHTKALAAYRKAMPKERAAYFRRHKSRQLRARFVKKQRAKVAALEKAARCRVKAPTTTGSSTPTAVRGPLAAGTYNAGPFRPRTEFTVGANWSVAFDIIATQLLVAQRADPGGLSITVDSFGGSRSVAERVTALSTLAGVTAEPPVAATVGGFAGQRFDALTTAAQLVVVPGLSDRYELEPNDRVRIYVIDVRSGTVTVIIEAPSAEWNAFLPVADAVVASLRFP
jgi:hypothetical protein